MSVRTLKGGAFKAVLLFSLAVGFLMLGVLLVDVFHDGVPYLDKTLFTNPPSSDPAIAGARPAILATIYMGILLLLFVVPIGVGTAVYLEEYAADTFFTRVVAVVIRNLAGVPAIVYGLLGAAIFARGGFEGLVGTESLLAAGLTLSILVLPIIVITSAEAIRAVPNAIRAAGFGE